MVYSRSKGGKYPIFRRLAKAGGRSKPPLPKALTSQNFLKFLHRLVFTEGPQEFRALVFQPTGKSAPDQKLLEKFIDVATKRLPGWKVVADLQDAAKLLPHNPRAANALIHDLMFPEEVEREWKVRSIIKDPVLLGLLPEEFMRAELEPVKVGGFPGLRSGNEYAFYVPDLRDIVLWDGKARLLSAGVGLKASGPEEAAKAVRQLLEIRSRLRSGQIDLQRAASQVMGLTDPRTIFSTTPIFPLPGSPQIVDGKWEAFDRLERLLGQHLDPKQSLALENVLKNVDVFDCGVKPKALFYDEWALERYLNHLTVDRQGKVKALSLTPAQIDKFASTADDPPYIRARLQQVRDFLDKHGFEVLVNRTLSGATPAKEVRPGLYLTRTSRGNVLFGDLEQFERLAEEKGWKIVDTGQRVLKKELRKGKTYQLVQGGNVSLGGSLPDAELAVALMKMTKLLRVETPVGIFPIFTAGGKAIAAIPP